MNRLFVLGTLFAVAACGGGSSSDPCEGVSGTCVPIQAGADREEIQTAMIEVSPDTTIAFEAGTYDIDGELDLDVEGITIQGAGMDETTLSFANQATGAQGLYVTKGDFTIQDIGLEDAPGDMLKVEGVAGVEIVRVRAEWTRGPNTDNGAYALYPVQCSDVHIAESQVRGASDAGVYVGQSTNIVVENNFVTENVAGIEIENSTGADVHDNESTGNTGGILVFNLPGLPVFGATTRVYDNNVHDNNELNFAPLGNIVGQVPTGTGIAILAAHEVEIFGNTIANHDSLNIGIISYTTTGEAYDDPGYDPNPTTIEIHDNTLTGDSTMPTGPLGGLLLLVMLEVQTDVNVPDIVWDGVLAPEDADPADPFKLMDALNICIRDNGDADFSNLHWPNQTDPVAEFDMTNHDCDHPDVPAVTL
jgi:parallel beta-helix repeat protein